MSSLIYLDEKKGDYLRNQRFGRHWMSIHHSMVPYEYRPDFDRVIIAKNNIIEGEQGK